MVEKRDALTPMPKTPYAPCAYDAFDVESMRAFREGRADSRQQQRVWEWIMFCAGAGTNVYNPDSSRDEAFACGKQFVAQSMHKLTFVSLKEERGYR